MSAGRRHAGMVVGGMAILLGIAVLGLLTWKTIAQWNAIPDTYPGASALRTDVLTRNALFALVILAIAGGVGSVCYLVFNRSLAAAQTAICVPLALAAGVLGYQAYRTYSPRSATSTPSFTPGPVVPIQPAKAPTSAPTVTPRPITLPRPVGSPAPDTPASSQESATPAAEPAPAVPAKPKRLADRPWAADPAHRDPASVAASLADADDPARPVLDKLAGDLSGAINAVLKDGVELDRLLTKPIPSTKPGLKDRIDLAERLETGASALADRLRGLRSEVDVALRGAGVDEVSCSITAGRFTEGVDSWKRAIAADDAGRTAGATAALHRLLYDNAGKWQINSQGTITTRERSLDGRIFMARSAFDHARDRLVPALRDLAAGTTLPEPTK